MSAEIRFDNLINFQAPKGTGGGGGWQKSFEEHVVRQGSLPAVDPWQGGKETKIIPKEGGGLLIQGDGTNFPISLEDAEKNHREWQQQHPTPPFIPG